MFEKEFEEVKKEIGEVIFKIMTHDQDHEHCYRQSDNGVVEKVLHTLFNYPERQYVQVETHEEFITLVSKVEEVIAKLNHESPLEAISFLREHGNFS